METSKDDMCRQYNSCFDFIKGIACICVVFMHCEFPGIFGTVVLAVTIVFSYAIVFFMDRFKQRMSKMQETVRE